jgi:replicative DNA helicase
MSDLRESGAIEQDADVIAFLHRPEKYAVTDDEKAKLAGRAELNVAKNRNGATGAIALTFQETLMRFVSGSPVQDSTAPAPSKGRWG